MFNPSTTPTDYELGTIEFNLLQLNARTEHPKNPTSKSSLSKDENEKTTSVHRTFLRKVSVAQLDAGHIVWLDSDRTKKYPDVYGVITHPALILKRLSSKYLAVVPLFDTPRYSSLFPPVTVDGHPYYIAIPNLRIVVSSHLTSARLVGKLNQYSFDSLVKQIATFLTP